MNRTRRIDASDPRGEPVCRLTPDQAHDRIVPIDRLLVQGQFRVTELGYELRLPSGDGPWKMATRYLAEEAECCPSMSFEAREVADGIVLRAFSGPDRPGA